MTDNNERLTDDADLASAHSETLLNSQLKVRKPEGPPAIGQCYNCLTKFPPNDGRRWCDAECRDDWLRFGQNETSDNK